MVRTRIGCLMLCLSLFFFKPKTAYDMRISDWSSDVCSSDLFPCSWRSWEALMGPLVRAGFTPIIPDYRGAGETDISPRSEERRVGKGCVSTGRSRWSPEH